MGAGATAAAAVETTGAGVGGGVGAAGSGSRIRAPSPLPNAFLAIGDNLLCKIDIGLRASTMNVVEVNRLSMAGRLGQSHVSRNHRLEHLAPEEASQI